uniref:Uncharacterized protein n=1 Tax=Geoglobus ahangari TaxID=113653 RepID=A0A7C4S9J2_9EURY
MRVDEESFRGMLEEDIRKRCEDYLDFRLYMMPLLLKENIHVVLSLFTLHWKGGVDLIQIFEKFFVI